MALFGFLKKDKQQDYYFLMDKDSNYLARGTLQSNPDNDNVLFKVLNGDIEEILRLEIVQVVPTDKTQSVTMGKATARRGNVVTIEPMRDMGMGVRKNFRMPSCFRSITGWYLYPTLCMGRIWAARFATAPITTLMEKPAIPSPNTWDSSTPKATMEML